MRIVATVHNEASSHQATVATAGRSRTLAIAARPDGRGSDVNGGEFLLLALATCYCNDLYREADRMGIELSAVDVQASADFEGVGLAASNIRYQARVASSAPADRIEALLQQTDAVAEVHNTVRSAPPVRLVPWESGS